jgi:hypothetical protein
VISTGLDESKCGAKLWCANTIAGAAISSQPVASLTLSEVRFRIDSPLFR